MTPDSWIAVLGMVLAAGGLTLSVLAVRRARPAVAWLGLGVAFALIAALLASTAVSSAAAVTLMVLAAVVLLLRACVLWRRRVAGDELSRSEQRYQFLVERLPEAFVVLSDGRVTYANRSFAKIFGVPVREALGQPLERWVEPAFRETFTRRSEANQTAAGLAVRRLELAVVRPDGALRWVEMRVQLSSWEVQPAEIVLIADITQRRRAEQRLERLNATLLSLGTDSEENLRTLTRACGELLSASFAFFGRNVAGSMQVAAGWNLPADCPACLVKGPCGCLDALAGARSGAPMVVSRAPSPTGAGCDVSLIAGFPIGGAAVSGALFALFRAPASFDEGDSNVLQLLATAVAVEEERRLARLRLAEREERYRKLFEATTDAVLVLRGDGRLLDCNEVACTRLGVRREELLLLAADELIGAEAAAALAVTARGDAPLEAVVRRRDGEAFPAAISARMVALGDEPTCVAYLRDLSAERQARALEAAVYEISEETQRCRDLDRLFEAIHRVVGRLMDARNLYIALHDQETDRLDFAYWVDEHDPRPEPHVAGRGLTAYVLRTARPQLVSPAIFEELVRRGEVEALGAPSIDWIGVPLVAGGRTLGVLVVQSYTEGTRYGTRELDLLTFVSSQAALAIERKRAEQELRDSEEMHRSLVENIQDAVFLVADGRLTLVNDAFARMAGAPIEELIGRDFTELVAPEDLHMVSDRHRKRLAGEQVPRDYEFRVLHRDGVTRIPVLMHVGNVEHRGTRATIGTLRDLTERRRLEEQAEQMRRIEALGQLAGGVAHDFNNLLMAITGSVELLERRLPHGLPPGEVGTIQRAISRAVQLTRGLLAFARRQVLQPVEADLNRAVSDALPLLRRVVPERIDLAFHPGEALASVKVDLGQLGQVLLDTAANARDTIAGAGRIEITTANVSIDEAYRATHPWARLGAHVRLSVIDDGSGMDEESLAHVFEPFHSARQMGTGIGLGLASVYGVVKQHGGMVDVASRPGQGTRVDVYLPAVGEAAAVATLTPPAVATQGGRETILVVEDEVEVRAILVEVLAGLGYTVLQAGDGEEALALLVAGQPEIDLVVSDVVMPRLGGRELFEAARRLAHVPIFLFSSGYGETLVYGEVVHGERTAFIAKPYGIEELAAKVRSLLDRAAVAEPASTGAEP